MCPILLLLQTSVISSAVLPPLLAYSRLCAEKTAHYIHLVKSWVQRASVFSNGKFKYRHNLQIVLIMHNCSNNVGQIAKLFNSRSISLLLLQNI